jgi:hypothetical protein
MAVRLGEVLVGTDGDSDVGSGEVIWMMIGMDVYR